MSAKRQRLDATVLVNLPEDLVQQARLCYEPVVKACLPKLGTTLSLDQLLLSVYLQGVSDGTQIQNVLQEINNGLGESRIA